MSTWLEEYIVNIWILFYGQEYIEWEQENGLWNEWDEETSTSLKGLARPISYVSLRGIYIKCFTWNFPCVRNKPIRTLGIKLNGSAFPHGIRPLKDDFVTFIGYPNQLFRSTVSGYVWSDSKVHSTDCYKEITYISNIEVMTRRNKPREPCEEDFKHHDAK